MPEITGLKEKRGRVRVFIEGEFWAEIDSLTTTGSGLREGMALPSEELYEIRVSGERPLAMERSFNLLGYRPRSRREIRQRLARHGYLDETIESVVSRLEELGYLDDGEYARNFARGKARKYGPKRIYNELLAGGVDEEAARSAVEAEFSESSESESAFQAAARRYNVEQGSLAQARKVYGFLMRRGFSAEVCAEVARTYRGEG